MPLVWAGTIVGTARREGKIRDDFAVKTILDAINQFRSLCGTLLSYDTISVPLVYTQVMAMGFLMCQKVQRITQVYFDYPSFQ